MFISRLSQGRTLLIFHSDDLFCGLEGRIIKHATTARKTGSFHCCFRGKEGLVKWTPLPTWVYDLLSGLEN